MHLFKLTTGLLDSLPNWNSCFYRKKLFHAVHMFVHLNLAISLLLGYLVFMFGIETATSSTVSCMKWHDTTMILTDPFQRIYPSLLLHSYWFIIMQVGCALVAALLHYFFLAAFCWMLCEGVMLYLMLVVVFSNLSKKWWFFLILGWGEGYKGWFFLSICEFFLLFFLQLPPSQLSWQQ